MLYLSDTIKSADSALILSCYMFEDGHKLIHPDEQAEFVIKQVNKSYFEHDSAKMDSIGQTKQAVLTWINKCHRLHRLGQQSMYFAYDTQTKQCVGLIRAQMVGDDVVEIQQLAVTKDSISRCDTIQLLEKAVLNNHSVRKVVVKLNADSIDTVRHSYLRTLGFKYESVSHNRILRLDTVDYVSYVKINPNASQIETPCKIAKQEPHFFASLVLNKRERSA